MSREILGQDETNLQEDAGGSDDGEELVDAHGVDEEGVGAYDGYEVTDSKGNINVSLFLIW